MKTPDLGFRGRRLSSDRALVLQKGRVVLEGVSQTVAADGTLAGFLGV